MTKGRTNPTEKSWSSTLGFCVGLITPPGKTNFITETEISRNKGYNGCSTTTCRTPEDAFITWIDGAMTTKSETQKGAHSLKKSLADRKTKVKIGCWNARTMLSEGKTAQITSEMVRYGIDILGITECRWSGFGRLRTQTRETIIYSGRDDDIHQSGVAIIMSKKAAQWLDSWIATSDRIIKPRFYSRFINTLFRFMLLR